MGPRGRRLWNDLTPDGEELRPTERVLLEEACRIADRLDRLDAFLTGADDAWLRWQVDESGTEVTVVVDRALSEARQQQMALKGVLAELRQSRTGTTAKPTGQRPTRAGAEQVKGAAGVADLTARIADRQRNATG